MLRLPGKKPVWVLVLSLCLAIILAACGGGESGSAQSIGAISVIPTVTAKSPPTVWSTPVAPAAPASDTPAPRPTRTITPTPSRTPSPTNTLAPTPTPTPSHPLMIEVMRSQAYPGSDLTFEESLEPGVNYDQTIVSYQSEGNKIYALLTVPWDPAPESGWPIIVFNHGYIPPDEYRTTERYLDYQDAFARNGYIVFRSDYRGHGDSEGRAEGGYGSPAYTVDVLNGLASVKRLPEADPERIGMWGHSMGGFITLRAMVVSDEIDAGVIWGGVVASYTDLFSNWGRRADDGPTPTPDPTRTRGRWRNSMTDLYGTPEENPAFWASISANAFLDDLSGPLQLHHATTDATVPVEFSETLYKQLQDAGVPSELYLYEGDNHNLFASFWTAMNRSIAFFDEYVKDGDS